MQCDWRKIKQHDGPGERSDKPSTWSCCRELNHDGIHWPAENAHQSASGMWEHTPTGRLRVQP